MQNARASGSTLPDQEVLAPLFALARKLTEVAAELVLVERNAKQVLDEYTPASSSRSFSCDSHQKLA